LIACVCANPAGRHFADVVVDIPPGRAVVEGHAAANEVEDAIEQVLPNSDVVVHVEPRRRGLILGDRVLAIALSQPAVSEDHDITIFDHGDQVAPSASSTPSGNFPTSAMSAPISNPSSIPSQPTPPPKTTSVGATASSIKLHQLGSELEEQLRKKLPSVADVVVHTEP
jgi:hypothetical protein